MPMPVRTHSSAGAVSILEVKKGHVVLLSCFGYNKDVQDVFIQLHDSATAPSQGATPVHSFRAAAEDNFSMIIPVTGMPFSLGCYVAVSSTDTTLTSNGEERSIITCTTQA